jgi:hypothetical protein
MSPRPLAMIALASLLAIAACGGTVVFEEDGGGAAGGGGSTGNGTSGPGNPSGPGPGTGTGVGTGTGTGTGVGTGTGTGVGTGVGTGTGTGPSTGSGGVFCDDHSDCTGDVCIFAIGECAPPCDGDDACTSCGAGRLCDGCATSSCFGCADCVAACAPIQPGQCDDDDACGNGEVCLHFSRTCAPACDEAGNCPDGGQFCDDCATGSCCGCRNCVPACVFGED